jgi:hypothetical protein
MFPVEFVAKLLHGVQRFWSMPTASRKVTYPEQFFFYRLARGLIVEIRSDPIAGAAPHGTLEQIGAKWQ